MQNSSFLDCHALCDHKTNSKSALALSIAMKTSNSKLESDCNYLGLREKALVLKLFWKLYILKQEEQEALQENVKGIGW